MKKYTVSVLLWLLFEAIAVTLWLMLDNLFYLFNFSYIGTCLALGTAFYAARLRHARTVVQFAVGLYMLVYLGILRGENMQIEGFWYYLFLGVFEAAVIHYVVAKILGPLFFGRGWCGYACWTAMVLDLLPFKTPRAPRLRRLGVVRYLVFALSLLFVGALFVLRVPNLESIMFWSFLAGNLLYYAVGIGLAFALRDNRAFCKYVCPVTVFLKPASYFSLLRVKNDTAKCVGCGVCKSVCPMDVDMTNNARNRRFGTECILCFSCIETCPKKALYL
ncbi:4Fe-4S binding protein [Feifania hominis]|uniref:4Fe-4S dicluster domain-containing protein n=1 Tax=Feifania hominis TaxID=2763660 RepID=A0A926DG21_9FIRM|nr:4Fe-4S dicluster domain-containing protein [Feifania hominis]MBC8537177.1 4Fe-4S dicluster domain-containing protein [Feifania hominis]